SVGDGAPRGRGGRADRGQPRPRVLSRAQARVAATARAGALRAAAHPPPIAQLSGHAPDRRAGHRLLLRRARDPALRLPRPGVVARDVRGPRHRFGLAARDQAEPRHRGAGHRRGRPRDPATPAASARAARGAGRRGGTPVAVGGADSAASTLAAGVTEPGEACLMLGTAGNLIMPLAAPDFDTRLINSHHVGCDRYLALGGTLSGALQEWFRSIAAPGAAFETL